MKVRDVMQGEVVTIDESATIDLADGLMRMDRIRHLPVLSKGRLVGVVTQRDLFRAGVALLAEPGPGEEPAADRQGIRVADVMAREVFTAHPDADLGAAIEMMLQQRVGCLPVVEDGRLVGLVSETDGLRALARLLGAHA